ncbi:PREDICTED: uncharacterized protein LOC104813100 [Tarenaya hassleriana]|uniref:uncharacterized protein LOC104813100 n=1 Tax=Tarenaya hassleriana TaxID=28532 RepID=UPI00053C21F3|nr:PREDICTED: uncharacterized protein LOC104813100 [Tarenaya hassleriana]
MAQHRQSGTERYGARGGYPHYSNGGASSDHVAIGIRSAGGGGGGKAGRWRRSARPDRSLRLAVGSILFVLCIVLVVTVLVYYHISGYSSNGNDDKGFDTYDGDFLTNVTRMDPSNTLMFGHGSVAHGRDSRYWDKDDRRRDDDYNEDVVDKRLASSNKSINEERSVSEVKKDFSHDNSQDWRGVGFYNEAGRNELKKYEAEYQASLEKGGQSTQENGVHHNAFDADHKDNDAIDSHDVLADDYVGSGHDENEKEESQKEKPSEFLRSMTKHQKTEKDDEEASGVESSPIATSIKSGKISRSEKRKRSRRASCEMKLLNSSQPIVEPLETRKFARFSLQYIQREEKPNGDEGWEPRFSGHQSVEEWKESFLVQDKEIHCGFVKGPKGTPSTGFDLSEDDANYISRCHIAVISCIFGNSDRLRAPASKMVSRLSRKNVCFVMFVDDITFQTLSSEGQTPDRAGFIGLWKLVAVKNLPYSDMRRVGKIPKLLPHRLFPSARYSIWLDSKLRLQLDPLLILEYFLWRKGHEYAISNHYDRHCVWEEVVQNKKLNKYNHTVINQQFQFYKADGLTRFNSSDPNKLLPSNVPEGSFIVRAHTPMSNLFSCLWFNEVERFTPRDQLSFAYTYQKLRKTNPDKPFYLHMFKDCERRKIAKLYRHRSEEKRNLLLSATMTQ